MRKDSYVKKFLQAMRNDLSAIDASKRCGFEFNKFSRWENGHSKITWTETLDCLTILNLPIAKSFKIAVPGFEDRRLTQSGRYLIGIATQKSLSKHQSISASTFTRWKTGKQSPPLSIILFILKSKGFLHYFLQCLFTQEALLIYFSAEFSTHNLRLNQRWQYPFISGVPRCLEIQSYRNLAEHKQGFIAKTLGLTLEQEKKALEVLESSKAIYKKDRKYFVAMDNKRTDTYADRHLRNRIISHWLKRAKDVVEQESQTIENMTIESENIWSYRTFASTPQLRQQIREMTVAFYASVRSAIEQYDDSQSDQVSVLSLNLFNPGAN